MKQKLKMYIVKKEVLATCIEKAVHGKGVCYSVELAEEKYQPEEKKKPTGFVKKDI